MDKLCISLLEHNFSDCEKSVKFLMDRDPNEVILSTDKGDRDTYFLLGKYPNYSLYIDWIYYTLNPNAFCGETSDIVKDIEKHNGRQFNNSERLVVVKKIITAFYELNEQIKREHCYARNLYIELN